MSESSDDLTCRELVEVITDYFEGVMSSADRERFERHVADCTGCTTVVEQFRETIEVSGRLTEDQVSDAQRETMRDVFRRWRDATSASGS
jgi:hypothetical protein